MCSIPAILCRDQAWGGLGKDAEELIDQISLACRDHIALSSHYHIANGVRASVAIAVQKGMHWLSSEDTVGRSSMLDSRMLQPERGSEKE